jgi:hypothetical protein
LFLPIYFVFFLGQPLFFLLFSLLLNFYLVKSGKNFYAGLALSLLMVKPYLLVLPLLFFLIKRNWYLISGAMLGISFFIVISILLVGVKGLLGYLPFVNYLMNQDHQFAMDPQVYTTIQGLWWHLSIYNSNSLIIYASYALILFALFWIWHFKSKTKDWLWNLQWGSSIVVSLLIAPHGYIQDYVLLIAVAVALFQNLKFEKKSFQKRVLSVIAVIYVFLFLVNVSVEIVFLNSLVLILFLFTMVVFSSAHSQLRTKT